MQTLAPIARSPALNDKVMPKIGLHIAIRTTKMCTYQLHRDLMLCLKQPQSTCVLSLANMPY
jgi:hypothetical protein